MDRIKESVEGSEHTGTELLTSCARLEAAALIEEALRRAKWADTQERDFVN